MENRYTRCFSRKRELIEPPSINKNTEKRHFAIADCATSPPMHTVLTGYSSYAVKGGAFVVSVDVLAPLAAIGITPPTHRSLLLCALCLK